ncbi:DDE-type integrase/transposase/recombinase [Rhizobium ruizarguesonis]
MSHLDEVVGKCAGEKSWPWRAADQHCIVLAEILRKRPRQKGGEAPADGVDEAPWPCPQRIISDKLRSYGAARADVAPGLDRWSRKGLNNRAENSHLPFRKRERIMQGQRSPGALQRFVSMHSARDCFSVPSRRRGAQPIRYHRLEAFDARNMRTWPPKIREP